MFKSRCCGTKPSTGSRDRGRFSSAGNSSRSWPSEASYALSLDTFKRRHGLASRCGSDAGKDVGTALQHQAKYLLCSYERLHLLGSRPFGLSHLLPKAFDRIRNPTWTDFDSSLAFSAPAPPKTMTKEWQEASTAAAKEANINPITGKFASRGIITCSQNAYHPEHLVSRVYRYQR